MKRYELQKIGVVGTGFVGGAVRDFFASSGRPVCTYDKQHGGTLADVLDQSTLVFLCLPTPMKEDGSCHTGIVEEVVTEVYEHLSKTKRLGEVVVVHKSTVWPGFTRSIQAAFPGLHFVYSPEFLTEKNAVADFASQTRLVAGADERFDATVLFDAHEAARPPSAPVCRYIYADPTEAELCKLFTNMHLFARVILANEMALVTEALGCSYPSVRRMVALDPRLPESHTYVPGHDGQFGAGGHCFPKDAENLRAMAAKLKVWEKLFSAVIERNKELRSHHDWLDMKGRAVL